MKMGVWVSPTADPPGFEPGTTI
ncbi:putative integrase [Sulfolobus acidocaldarius]